MTKELEKRVKELEWVFGMVGIAFVIIISMVGIAFVIIISLLTHEIYGKFDSRVDDWWADKRHPLGFEGVTFTPHLFEINDELKYFYGYKPVCECVEEVVEEKVMLAREWCENKLKNYVPSTCVCFFDFDSPNDWWNHLENPGCFPGYGIYEHSVVCNEIPIDGVRVWNETRRICECVLKKVIEE